MVWVKVRAWVRDRVRIVVRVTMVLASGYVWG